MVKIPPRETLFQGKVMVKIFFLLMIMSSPNQTTVKYSASIYPTEELCLEARKGYMEAYEQSIDKDSMKTKAICIPFESFPILGMTTDTIGA
jgi:hypothetical protein